MISAVLFVSLLVGVLFPKFIRRPRAFGIAVILIVLELLAEALGVSASYLWINAIQDLYEHGVPFEPGHFWMFVMIAVPLLKVIAGICLLAAYWPGGSLLRITGRESESTAPPA